MSKVLRAELGPSLPTQIPLGLMIVFVRLKMLAVSLKMLAVSLNMLAVSPNMMAVNPKMLAGSLEVLTPRNGFSLCPFRCRLY